MHAAATKTLELPISAFDSRRDFAADLKSLPPVQVNQLSAEAKDLALEHEKFQEEFDLLEQELIQIRSFIATDIVRQWKIGNTVQLVKNIKKLIKKLDRSFTILKELADQIRHNAKKCESGKAWSVFYGVLATGACAGAICTGNKGVYTTVCGVSIGWFLLQHL